MKDKLIDAGYWVLTTAFALAIWLIGCWTAKNMINQVFAYYGIKEISMWGLMLVVSTIWILRKLVTAGED